MRSRSTSMVYTTFFQGLKEANEAAAKATQLEATSTPSFSRYQLVILPALIHAATLYSRLLQSGLVPKEHRPVVVGKWKKVLERAEVVRGVVERGGGDVAAGGGDSGVLGKKGDDDQALSFSILRQSSTLNSHKIPLWTDSLSLPSSEAWTIDLDSDEVEVLRPDLSDEMTKWGAEWIDYSPSSENWPTAPEIDGGVEASSLHPDSPIEEETELRIEQGISADCSFVAALAVCLAHNLRFAVGKGGSEKREMVGLDLAKELVVREVGPGKGQEHRRKWYRVKMFVNGDWRSIIIDSTLPKSTKTNLPMHATLSCTKFPNLPCSLPLPKYIPLLEKAYLSLLSPTGYSYSGSTPSFDMQTLTGWIADHISLVAPGFRREGVWKRVWEAWKEGRVLVCLGTGKGRVGRLERVGGTRRRRRSRSGAGSGRGRGEEGGYQVEEGLGGLIPLHAYGVVEMWDDEKGRGRGFRIVNPWRAGGRSPQNGTFAMGEMSMVLEEEEVDRVFDMSWDEACDRFESLDLCWDPDMFKYKEVIHGIWKPSREVQAHVVPSIATPIRLEIDAPNNETEIWIQLSRHLVETGGKTEESVALHLREVGQGVVITNGMISEDVEMGEYTNGSVMLERFQCRKGKTSVLVTPAREGLSTPLGFTVTAYCKEAFTMKQTKMALAYEVSVDSSFRGKTSGGSTKWPTSMNNPQFALDVKPLPNGIAQQTASIQFTLTGPHEIPFNLKLVRARGERVIELSHGDIVTDSGPYAHGVAQAQIETVPGGRFTVVVSTFTPGQHCDFSLHAASTLPLRLSDISQEGAGMYSRVFKGSWSEAKAAGRPSEGNYTENPTLELIVPDPAEVMLRLSLLEPIRTPLNLTVFMRGPGGILGDQVATTGPYEEKICGVSTGRINLASGIYLMVVSTYSAGICADFQVTAYGTKAIELQPVSV